MDDARLGQAGATSEADRIRTCLEQALADALCAALQGSDIEHAVYTLEAIADQVLQAVLSRASDEGLSLQPVAHLSWLQHTSSV